MDFYRLRSEGDNALSVSPSVSLCVCLSMLLRLNRLILALIFSMEIDIDLGQAGIVGQGRRSKVKFKCSNSCLTSLLVAFYLVWGQSQGSESSSKVGVKVKYIRSLACQVQQKAITLNFEVKGGHYRFEGFVCVSVIRGCMQIITQMRSISF